MFFHKAAGNVFSHSSPLMLVKPFYAIDISHWVVRLEIDAQQKDCKVERTQKGGGMESKRKHLQGDAYFN